MKNLSRLQKNLALVSMLALVVLVIWWSSGDEQEHLLTTAQRGDLVITVQATGELNAENSEKILGPRGMRRAGVWNVKITDLVPEGTYVKEGDFIATLDRTELANKLKETAAELDKTQSEFKASRLDTALTMREARDNLINLKYALEEKQLILSQSKYEPPATIRQAEIDLEKAKRAYEQAVENYNIKQDQAEAKVSQVAATLRQTQMKYDQSIATIEEFTIKAPKSGMLVYHRDWDGRKIQIGSQVSAWNPIVATLPDLSSMVSQTYINEIDISKIKVGQRVDIAVDAFPDRSYGGQITTVANVGEQLPNSDAKVFEVNILLDQTDTILRPSMTTANEILIEQFEDVVYVPIESVLKHDSVPYVNVDAGLGWVPTEVKTGPANENYIIIEAGLKEGDKVLLSRPEDITDDFAVKRLADG